MLTHEIELFVGGHSNDRKGSQGLKVPFEAVVVGR